MEVAKETKALILRQAPRHLQGSHSSWHAERKLNLHTTLNSLLTKTLYYLKLIAQDLIH